MKGVRESFIKDVWDVILATFSEFGEHKIMKMSASLAYTTVFSMGPMLLVILFVIGSVWGRDAIEGAIFNQAKDFVGVDAAKQIQEIIKNIAIANNGNLTAYIGIITLLIGATSVFAEIQDSINTIWGIRPKKRSGFWMFLKTRLLSFGVIGSLGFILLVSLFLSAILESLNSKLFSHFSNHTIYLVFASQNLINLFIIMLLFGVIFKVLPDANVTWKQVRVSSLTTAVLFMFGKFLISYYISNSHLGSAYGAAGSLVIIMVWVYYSSIILYVGALFTKCYAVEFGAPIRPSKFAEIVQTVHIKSEAETIQEATAEKKILNQNNT